MSNLKYHKSFILEHVEKDSDILPVKFYSELIPGKYIGLKFIIVQETYVFFGKYKSKSGFYEYGLLCYSTSEENFFILLPCFFTEKKIDNMYKSLILNNEDQIMVLIKKQKMGKYPSRTPLWENGLLSQYFNLFTQIYLYEVYSHEDENSGKVRKLVNKDIKQYVEFIKLYKRMN